MGMARSGRWHGGRMNSRRYKLFIAVILVAVVGLLLSLVLKHRHPAAPKPVHGAVSMDDEFMQLMKLGMQHLDKGEAQKALEAYQKALQIHPAQVEIRLNLAITHLWLNQPDAALQQAQEAIQLDRNSAAGYYLAGCACLRKGRFDEAIQHFQNSMNLDPSVATLYYMLGQARLGAGQTEAAIDDFREAIRLQADHPVAWFALSQVLNRLGRASEAADALAKHQEIKSKSNISITTPAESERCKHTQPRLPFKVEQPDSKGIKVVFADTTATVFARAGDTTAFHGPMGVIDFKHDGSNGLFVVESGGFRLLANSNGFFVPAGVKLAGVPDGRYRKVLVGDLQNDRMEDIVVLGEGASHVFKVSTNGEMRDVTPMTNLRGLACRDGIMLDLDFTGKLDLIVAGTNGALQVFQNLDNFLFRQATATSGIPANLDQVVQVVAEDWNGDDANDILVARRGLPPVLLEKLRAGSLTNAGSFDWPAGIAIAAGDLNNDLRADFALLQTNQITIIYGGQPRRFSISFGPDRMIGIVLLDYDNDGWLDIFAFGDRIRCWRNLGDAGWKETTAEVGLDAFKAGLISHIAAADFDGDGDTDIVVALESGGLRMLANNGGNANRQLKIRLMGNRSNASGLGVRIQVTAGGLRFARRVQQLPIELGVGSRSKVDAITVEWYDLALSSVDVEVSPQPLLIPELTFPKGSCPYIYAWDGRQFRFVSDFLGSSPLGLPAGENVLVEADPFEYLWLGNESNFKPRDGRYQLQITEELSEVLYLDEAALVVVDHPQGTVVHPTSKMLPGPPFPKAEIWTLHRPHSLRKAVRNDGLDVTAALQKTDSVMASPCALRSPQLRGQAEPWSVTLDFGPLQDDRPLVLALTGWIRFGGGMGNMAAARNPNLPFPFPVLEAETTAGQWQPVETAVGTPSGKTKTILVDLADKLPHYCKRLRVSTAFEIHWDCIELYEREQAPSTRFSRIKPFRANLHWRGYSLFEDLPWYLPLTPDYQRLAERPNWKIVPMGWCTRYGEVGELISEQDDALAIINAGDELTVEFDAKLFPEKPPGYERDFFLFSVGWDKDTDFHIRHGTTVDPLPWRGLNSQMYGLQPRPAMSNDNWMSRYNTRWVGPWARAR